MKRELKSAALSDGGGHTDTIKLLVPNLIYGQTHLSPRQAAVAGFFTSLFFRCCPLYDRSPCVVARIIMNDNFGVLGGMV
jgi:hypothetical protein